MHNGFTLRRLSRRNSSALAIVIALAAVPVGAASAQAVAPADEGPDEGVIVVTAQRRTEALQKVPISISVISGKVLDRSSARGTSDVLRAVPGVNVLENFQTGGTTIAIRGVTASSPISSGGSPVAYYLDTVPFGFVKNALTPDAAAYDLDRVEVLRGPQGTLYGASALNGVVRVLTADPDLGKVEAKVRGAISTTKQGGENYRGDVAINSPLIADKLGIRAVVGYQSLSGWVDAPNRKDVNDGDLLNLRLKVKAQPTEDLTIGLSSWISRVDYGGPSSGAPNRTTTATLDEGIHPDFDSYGLTVAYDFSAFTVSSATSYLKYKLRSAIDLGTLAPSLAGSQLDADVDAKTFTQEVNLTSTSEGPWRWTLGGIYRNGKDRIVQLRHLPDGTPSQGYFRPSNVRYLSESYAVFGELTRLFADGRVELTGGLRYFHDDVGVREIARFDNDGTALASRDSSFHALTPRVLLTWHPTDRLTTYVSYSRGFRSGGDQNPTVFRSNPAFGPYGPDKLDNYELGLKGSILDGHVAFDASVYYIDWKNVQQVLGVLVGSAQLTGFVNAGSASGPGADLSVTIRPVRRLTLNLNYSYNDLTFDQTIFTGTSVLYNKGDRLAVSQKTTMSGSIDYRFPIGGDGYEGGLSVNGNTGSKIYNVFGTPTGPSRVPSDRILQVGASVSLASPAGWTASLFADNLTDEKGSPSAGAAPNTGQRLRPRTIGVQFEFKM